MFLRFFSELRDAKVPVSLREYLTLMQAMDQHVIGLITADAISVLVGRGNP